MHLHTPKEHAPGSKNYEQIPGTGNSYKLHQYIQGTSNIKRDNNSSIHNDAAKYKQDHEANTNNNHIQRKSKNGSDESSTDDLIDITPNISKCNTKIGLAKVRCISLTHDIVHALVPLFHNTDVSSENGRKI